MLNVGVTESGDVIIMGASGRSQREGSERESGDSAEVELTPIAAKLAIVEEEEEEEEKKKKLSIPPSSPTGGPVMRGSPMSRGGESDDSRRELTGRGGGFEPLVTITSADGFSDYTPLQRYHTISVSYPPASPSNQSRVMDSKDVREIMVPLELDGTGAAAAAISPSTTSTTLGSSHRRQSLSHSQSHSHQAKGVESGGGGGSARDEYARIKTIHILKTLAKFRALPMLINSQTFAMITVISASLRLADPTAFIGTSVAVTIVDTLLDFTLWFGCGRLIIFWLNVYGTIIRVPGIDHVVQRYRLIVIVNFILAQVFNVICLGLSIHPKYVNVLILLKCIEWNIISIAYTIGLYGVTRVLANVISSDIERAPEKSRQIRQKALNTLTRYGWSQVVLGLVVILPLFLFMFSPFFRPKFGWFYPFYLMVAVICVGLSMLAIGPPQSFKRNE